MRKLQVQFIRTDQPDNPEGIAALGDQEYLGLEDVIVNDQSDSKKRKRHHRSDSEGSSPKRFKRSRSRSLSQEVRERERKLAAASRPQDVAKRPASFKSAMSL